MGKIKKKKERHQVIVIATRRTLKREREKKCSCLLGYDIGIDKMQ